MSNLTVKDFMDSQMYVYYVVTGILMITVSVFGLLANFLVVVVACVSDAVEGNYRWPIANMALFDAIFAFCSLLNGNILEHSVSSKYNNKKIPCFFQDLTQFF